ncbi:methionine gamma-lyase [Thalassotalea mangrovi]|uniref:L-methionine gamma-lyase n=1 Tax=Thalassotalea mangrovi TaxID=2572245 RepID=A0A4U1B9Q1_9GAMM|nr:methionine gamma-lyase [Thalassotalea mangrovi]TKB47510.1 methionine gamma-lyase [Thalassotalea mangrovi]
MKNKYNHIETATIHAGRIKDEQFGALTTPIYQTSTFVFDNAEQGGERFAGESSGYIYSRLGNPTVRQFEMKVAQLEGMEDAAATATGMGAVSAALLTNLSAGDHLIASKALYGCSYALIRHQLTRFGIEVTFVDMTQEGSIETAVKENTKVIFAETPINPTLDVIDLEMLGNVARKHQLISIVDNTFLTPILQQPIRYGIDIVIHSATKYLNGHGDVVAGIVCGSNSMIEKIKLSVLKDIGATMSPHDAWLILRGMKTLAIRVKQHCQSAQIVAEYLEAHPKVKRVYYPGLKNHPGNPYMDKQMLGAGGVIGFEIIGGLEDGKAMINSTELFSIAVSLGDAESLIQHPASMTHSPYSPEERLEAGISDGLIRIAVGLEHVDDIIADLEHALSVVPEQTECVAGDEQNMANCA